MGYQKQPACSWTLVDEAKDILINGDHSSNSINTLIRYLKDELNLTGISIRQRISRPLSLRIMYECMENSSIKRINQTITYSDDNWDSCITEYKKGVYVYYYSEKDDPIPGVISRFKPKSILQLPHFLNGVFLGTLDFIDFETNRRWEEKDIEVLSTIKEMIFHEITKLDEDSVSRIAEYDKDYVTGLSRYEQFIENIDRAIPECTKGDNSILLVYSDIHHFKLINETYGYRKGDELLRTYAQQIHFGKTYIDACRVYSDNFIVAYQITDKQIGHILPDMDTEHKWLSRELRKSCPDSHIRICSGIYIISDNNIDAATAVTYANMARKQSKMQKGLHCIRFSSNMLMDMKWHAYLNNELPKAIENHNLLVYYQPKIACKDGKLFGAEALVRWRKDDGTFIYPDEFIPEFESNGNIVSVDYYVFEEVFRFIRERLDKALPIVPISMNVSRLHLESDAIIPFIRSLLKKYRVPPKYIEFELTENIYMQNMEPAKEFITTCNQMEIPVSMDDFGSGYSSLNMISSLQIDVLKIDKIFMKNETLNENDKIVLNSVINMAKNLHMKVLCEGVETKNQVDFLTQAGCDIIQGYYYGKPMPKDDFKKVCGDSEIS